MQKIIQTINTAVEARTGNSIPAGVKIVNEIESFSNYGKGVEIAVKNSFFASQSAMDAEDDPILLKGIHANRRREIIFIKVLSEDLDGFVATLTDVSKQQDGSEMNLHLDSDTLSFLSENLASMFASYMPNVESVNISLDV